MPVTIIWNVHDVCTVHIGHCVRRFRLCFSPGRPASTYPKQVECLCIGGFIVNYFFVILFQKGLWYQRGLTDYFLGRSISVELLHDPLYRLSHIRYLSTPIYFSPFNYVSLVELTVLYLDVQLDFDNSLSHFLYFRSSTCRPQIVFCNSINSFM